MMMMMKKKNTATATERPDFDFHRLVCAATKEANSNSIDGIEQCLDILRYLKSLSLNVKDLLRNSKTILPLESLRDHGNPKIRNGANVLFNSWMKTLYSSSGRDLSSSCSRAAKKPEDVAKGCSKSTKKEHQISGKSSSETKKISELLGLEENEDETGETKLDDSQTHETKEIDQNLNKADACKSVSTKSKPLQMKKKQPPVEVSGNPKECCPALKKNSTEMLELFEIAKKSADVANTKGLLLAKAETSISVDTLSLLMSFPISSTATETRRIMERLARLTRHKDRKICNSAFALLQHWSQSIRDQQRQDSRQTQG